MGVFQLNLHPALTTHRVHLGYARRSLLDATLAAMFDIGDSLRDAIGDARMRLESAQGAVARANSGEAEGRSADAAMARTAQAAIFMEALLGAQRARLEEIKAVAK